MSSLGHAQPMFLWVPDVAHYYLLLTRSQWLHHNLVMQSFLRRKSITTYSWLHFLTCFSLLIAKGHSAHKKSYPNFLLFGTLPPPPDLFPRVHVDPSLPPTHPQSGISLMNQGGGCTLWIFGWCCVTVVKYLETLQWFLKRFDSARCKHMLTQCKLHFNMATQDETGSLPSMHLCNNTWQLWTPESSPYSRPYRIHWILQTHKSRH